MTNNRNDPRRYDDMLNHPAHVSVTHPHMSLYDRAAQFAPFKALTGYEDDVEESARLTDKRIELDDDRIERLDAKLQLLEEHLAEVPTVSITFFQPDARKEGGSYETVSGVIKKIDTIHRKIIFKSGQNIAIDCIYEVNGELFENYVY